MRRVPPVKDDIHRGNQGRQGPRQDLSELRLFVPNSLLAMLDGEVKRMGTNRAQLTRLFIREGLERLITGGTST